MFKQINLKKVIKVVDEVTDGIMVLFFILCLLIGIYIGYDSYYVYSQASGNRVATYKPVLSDDNSVDVSALRELSNDVVGWLTIDDTKIDYPLMQGRSNSDYINTDPYGDFSLSGSIFIDSANSGNLSDKYNLIYGHHMEHGFMFGALDDYRDWSFGDNHRTGRIITLDGEVIELSLLAVVDGRTTDNEVFDVGYSNASPELISNYLETHNLYMCDVLNDDARLFALSTCKSATSQERLIVFFIEVV